MEIPFALVHGIDAPFHLQANHGLVGDQYEEVDLPGIAARDWNRYRLQYYPSPWAPLELSENNLLRTWCAFPDLCRHHPGHTRFLLGLSGIFWVDREHNPCLRRYING